MENIELPNNFNLLNKTEKDLATKYLNQLSETEKKAYLIAKEHLETSFDLFKSNGFKNWEKSINS